jgi:hypothetical protein
MALSTFCRREATIPSFAGRGCGVRWELFVDLFVHLLCTGVVAAPQRKVAQADGVLRTVAVQLDGGFIFAAGGFRHVLGKVGLAQVEVRLSRLLQKEASFVRRQRAVEVVHAEQRVSESGLHGRIIGKQVGRPLQLVDGKLWLARLHVGLSQEPVNFRILRTFVESLLEHR